MVLGAGELFGKVALLTDRTRTGRVRAKADVRCRALARADPARLLAEQPRIAVHMLPMLASRPPTRPEAAGSEVDQPVDTATPTSDARRNCAPAW